MIVFIGEGWETRRHRSRQLHVLEKDIYMEEIYRE